MGACTTVADWPEFVRIAFLLRLRAAERRASQRGSQFYATLSPCRAVRLRCTAVPACAKMPKNINRPSLLGARLLVILAVALAACAAAKAAHAEGVSALHGAGAATRPRVAWREAASNSAHFPARTPLAEPGQGQQQPRSSRSQGAGEAGEEEEEEGGYGHWTIGFGISVMFSFLSSLGINLQKKSLMQHVGVPAFRQPVWVTGFLLVAFGSLLDFVAFGLAPQSLLAPLAALTLVWNMCISVRVLGEALTVRHVRATLVIFAGCTLTVVFAHKATPAYTLDDLKSLYAQPSMIAYLIIMPAFMALHYAYVRRARRHAQSSYAALVEDELHHDPELGASNQALLRSQDVTPGADARSPGGLELGGLRAAANDMASASGGAPMSPMSPSRVQHGATPSARDRRAHNAWPLPSSTTTATSPVPAALPSRPLTQALAESVEEEESSVTVAPLELITGMKQRSPGFWNRVTLIAYGGLAGSFGGQTVLFAKSTVELLKSAVFHGDDGLRHVEAYLIIAGLAACLVGQVHFLNGGLKRHDSLQMVPVYQVRRRSRRAPDATAAAAHTTRAGILDHLQHREWPGVL